VGAIWEAASPQRLRSYSPKCVEQEFCELRSAFWGHIVSLISTMATTAPAQMARSYLINRNEGEQATLVN
jgi:hypothetical protein